MGRKCWIHWCGADPFYRTVVTIVGDLKAGLKTVEREFKWEGFCDRHYEDFKWKAPEDKQPDRPFCTCGITFLCDGDCIVYFPRFPYPWTLIHELEHAKDFVLETAGVKDTEGETDAYLLGYLCRYFLLSFAYDIEKHTEGAQKWITDK